MNDPAYKLVVAAFASPSVTARPMISPAPPSTTAIFPARPACASSNPI
jgi:hypothetical protein